MQSATDLRVSVARSLHGTADAIVQDAVALFPFSGIEQVPPDDRIPLAERTVQLLIAAVRDGTTGADAVLVAELLLLAERTGVGTRQLFTVVYLVERAAVDALALDDSFGISSAPWPTVTQLVRRSAFDLCAAVAEWMAGSARVPGITDPLTTLPTGAVFVTAVEKEIERAERFGEAFALMLVEVDRLADVSSRYGYGAGSRVLERVGIIVRNYLRESDWVARLDDDTFGVLLPAIHGHNAERLAERMRVAVQERLQVRDHRSDQQFPVTISVGVLVAESVSRADTAARFIAAAQEAVGRAKTAGGNRMERATIAPQGA